MQYSALLNFLKSVANSVVFWYNVKVNDYSRKDVVGIKVFDFDNTIYRGESSVDFAFYMLRHNKRILLFLPSLFWNAASYKLCLASKETLEKRINDAIKFIVRDKTELISLTDSF